MYIETQYMNIYAETAQNLYFYFLICIKKLSYW